MSIHAFVGLVGSRNSQSFRVIKTIENTGFNLNYLLLTPTGVQIWHLLPQQPKASTFSL